jgi:hypothetical protein
MESQEPERIKQPDSEQSPAQRASAEFLSEQSLSEQQLQELIIEIFKQAPGHSQRQKNPKTNWQPNVPPEDAFLNKLRGLMTSSAEPQPSAPRSLILSPSPQTPHPSSVQPSNIYRFSLPRAAATQELQEFRRKIKALRQANPGWRVSQDFPRPDEAEAVVVFRQNQDLLQQRVAYWLTSALAGLIEEPYDG